MNNAQNVSENMEGMGLWLLNNNKEEATQIRTARAERMKDLADICKENK